MLWFTGVSTGNKYEAGQTYRNGDGTTSVAQPDGSFINQQTGVRTVGSSEPKWGQSVEWSYTGPSYSSGVPFAASDHKYITDLLNARSEAATRQAVGSGYAGVSPGHGSSVPTASLSGAGGSSGASRGGSGSFAARAASFNAARKGTAEASWSQPSRAMWDEYKDGPSSVPESLFFRPNSPTEVKGRPLPFQGMNWEMNPNWPSAEKIEEELGEGELFSPAWFMNWGIALSSISWNASRVGRWADENHPFVMSIVRESSPGRILDMMDYSNSLPHSENKAFNNALNGLAGMVPVNKDYDSILREYQKAGIAANGM